MSPRTKQSDEEKAAAAEDKAAKKEAEESLTREEKEAIEDGEDLAEKYVAEQEARADDDPLKLQKRDEEQGEVVPAGEIPSQEEEDED